MTHGEALAVWAGVGAAVLAGLLAGPVSGGRFPRPGELLRVATAGPVRRTLVLLAWMWLGWHTFAR